MEQMFGLWSMESEFGKLVSITLDDLNPNVILRNIPMQVPQENKS